jgi:hypothetical protein
MALKTVSACIDAPTLCTLRGEGDVADPPRSLSDVIRHVLTTHAAQVEAWLAGERPRPETMLPRGEFDEFVEQNIRNRAKRVRAGGPTMTDQDTLRRRAEVAKSKGSP